jgi:hypothetical protein
MWLTPKTDWTAQDVLNADDMNRIEINTEHVKTYLMSISYSVSAQTHVTDRTFSSYETVSSVNRIEQNIEALRSAFTTPAGWQTYTPWTYSRGLTHHDVNRWELSVKQLYELAQSAFEGIRYCGTFVSGQEGLP